MLTEQQLIAYLEGTLGPEDRAAVEAALDQDPALRQQVLAQASMESALRVSLGGRDTHARIRDSVLAVVRGEQEDRLKRRVLADTAAPARTEPWWRGFFQRPAWVTGLAGACLLLVVAGWWFLRERPAGPSELPSLVHATGASLSRAGRTSTWTAAYQPQPGDELQLGADRPGFLRYADGTVIQLQPGSRCRLADSRLASQGGKQVTLLTGALSATVAKQASGRPLLLHTPHAVATVLGTSLDLSVATNETNLEVSEGAVALARRSDTSAVTVRAGEYATASPESVPRARPLGRSPFHWPFSSASPWNRPLGTGARFEPVRARPFLADGPLLDATLPRRLFRGGPGDPVRGVWVNGERRAEVWVADGTSWPQGSEPFALLQPGRRTSLDLVNVRWRPDGDLDAEAAAPVDLAGWGTGQEVVLARPFGFSALGGLLRTAELERGIPHALAARVEKSRLNVRPPGGGVCVWPATNPLREPPANGEITGNIHVGTLLALPPDVDITQLSLPESLLPLARALQDYGVYVTGPGPRPFALLTEGRPAAPADLDAALNRLVPLLQVVTNNTPDTPGGGGAPRRPPAPAFPGEVR